MLSRSDSERQRNLMIHDQCPLPVYFSQMVVREKNEKNVCECEEVLEVWKDNFKNLCTPKVDDTFDETHVSKV